MIHIHKEGVDQGVEAEIRDITVIPAMVLIDIRMESEDTMVENVMTNVNIRKLG